MGAKFAKMTRTDMTNVMIVFQEDRLEGKSPAVYNSELSFTFPLFVTDADAVAVAVTDAVVVVVVAAFSSFDVIFAVLDMMLSFVFPQFVAYLRHVYKYVLTYEPSLHINKIIGG